MNAKTRNVLKGAGDYAAWIFAREATANLARASQEWMTEGNWAEAARLAQEHANKAERFQAGHTFEFVEALKFNAAAAQAGEAVRAVTTASQGQGTAAADIIISAEGEALREVQAKLYERASGALTSLRADKYDGMQRLVALDKEGPLRELLTKRLGGDPDAIYMPGYRDVDAHLAGELHHDGVTSGGTTTDEAYEAAADPTAWLRDQSIEAVTNETLKAAALGAAGGAVFAGAASSLSTALRVRRGELTTSEAIVELATVSATAGIRSGTTSGLATLVKVGASTSEMLSPLAESTAPIAIASAILSTGQSAYDYALGRIDRDEFTAQCGEVAMRNTGAWAFGVVGQSVIPVPVVGALVGSTVGYVTSAVVLEGLKLARVAAAAADASEERLAELERQALAAIKSLEEHRLTLEVLIREEAQHFAETIEPLLGAVEDQLTAGADVGAMDSLVALNLELGAKLEWSTLPEFDDFMSDVERPLYL